LSIIVCVLLSNKMGSFRTASAKSQIPIWVRYFYRLFLHPSLHSPSVHHDQAFRYLPSIYCCFISSCCSHDCVGRGANYQKRSLRLPRLAAIRLALWTCPNCIKLVLFFLVYFDIKQGNKSLGRVVIGLFGKVCICDRLVYFKFVFSSLFLSNKGLKPLITRMFPRQWKTFAHWPLERRDLDIRVPSSIV